MATTKAPVMTHERRRRRKADLLSDLRAGMSIQKAARKHRLARITALTYAKEAGLGIPAGENETAPRGLLIVSDYLKGKASAQIARDRRLTVSQVNLWIRWALELGVVQAW